MTRAIHGKTIVDVLLNTPGLSEALVTGFNNAVRDKHEYGGFVYETNGVLRFKGPKKGDKASFCLDICVRDNAPQGASTNLVAVWHVHPLHNQARSCRPSDEDICNAKSKWLNVFYLVITGMKQLKNDKPFPGADKFIDVSLPGMGFKICF
ncbi:hypothetical protein SCHPADRAFT_933980 [Schizopora paradoxa]|uniref:DUF4329 domain-containing protein n=1 Tax=Schizopora paradoxa TaxID=27342 RepID=A0A0H2QYT3_9AGAM|nr:hypothetical protein SCHPADRAFT_933980 [Schizopora paradoxa]